MAKASIKGLRKREGAVRNHPFNTDLIRWMRKELICKSDGGNNGKGSLYEELYTACILGFSRLLRISEIAALTWGDISADTHITTDVSLG